MMVMVMVMVMGDTTVFEEVIMIGGFLLFFSFLFQLKRDQEIIGKRWIILLDPDS